MYEPGATANCGKPLCCQKDQAKDAEDGAGHWGDYRSCDMPWYAMENLLDQIVGRNKNESGDISYVYFTGDIISHRAWKTSIEGNQKEIQKLFRMMKQKLGSIPVFPVIGNHESHPLNMFAPFSVPNKFSIKWLYDLVAKEWAVWLPKSALDTIHIGGYYTVPVKPGFRIIVLNTNVCYTLNLWLLYENVDLYDELKWLVRELLKAERAKEAVHILTHSPPGDKECLIVWSREFQRIVERFAYTITAQFHGHTHFDDFKVFYNRSNIAQPINVAYNGGFYRLDSFQDDFFHMFRRVTDVSGWIYQIPLANLIPNNTPNWYQHYSFKNEYNLKNLQLDSLDHLVQKMKTEKKLLEKYYRYIVSDSQPGMVAGCN